MVESAAVGVRVEGAGGEEEIKICVALHPGADLDPVALLDYCRERMPRYAVPRYVEVLDELDKTPSGKIRKQAIRDAGVSLETWDRGERRLPAEALAGVLGGNAVVSLCTLDRSVSARSCTAGR